MKEKKAKNGHKWQQVKSYLLSQISDGNYRPGDILPSENYLCEKENVSRNTVRQALKELENEGMIYRVRGKGTFLSDYESPNQVANQETFGLILQEVSGRQVSSLIQGFDDTLYPENYQTLICQTGDDISKQGNIILRLIHRGIDGVAIIPSTCGKTPAFQIQLLIDNGIPVVLCHRGVTGIQAPTLTWDMEETGRIAGKFLLENGHKNIAYFGTYKYELTEANLRGLSSVMAESGISLRPSHVIFGPCGDSAKLSTEREKLAADLLGSDQSPTAIFFNNDNDAEMVYWLAMQMGIRIPQDISIISFGDCHRNSMFSRMLTSVVLDEYDLGVQTAKMLYQMKKKGEIFQKQKPRMLRLDISRGKTVQKK